MPKPPSRTAPEARLADAELPSLTDVRAWPVREVEVRCPGGTATIGIRDTPGTAADVEPALFVHGLGGSALNWTDVAALLRGRLAIESIDLFGHGRSGPAPREDYSIDAQAGLVIAYLEQSGRGPVHLAGNSMGGAISTVVAVRRPDLVRTLTLISPAVPDNRLRVYPLRFSPMMSLTILPVLGEWVFKQMSKRYAVEVRAAGTITLCFADRTRYPQARMDDAIDEARRRVDLPWAESAFLRSMRGLVRWQFLQGRRVWRTLSDIAVPTLVLWGDTDRLVAPDLAPYVAAAIPDARLLVLEDIGHTAMMEDPRTSARAMLGLLDDVHSGKQSTS